MHIVKNDTTKIMEVQNSNGYTFCFVVEEDRGMLKAEYDEYKIYVTNRDDLSERDNYNNLYDMLTRYVDTLPDDEDEEESVYCETKYYLISGYWKDDKTEFENRIVKSTHDVCDDDEDIFFYGLDKEMIEDAIKLGENVLYDFVITEYGEQV